MCSYLVLLGIIVIYFVAPLVVFRERFFDSDFKDLQLGRVHGNEIYPDFKFVRSLEVVFGRFDDERLG